MKNSLLLPVVFIVNFILWLAAFSVFAGLWEYLMFGSGNKYFLLYAMLHTMYLTLPLACMAAIFSAYVFLMRHYSKHWLSFLLFVLTFVIFFIGVIPAGYSQGKKIDYALQAQSRSLTGDDDLAEFIERPAFIQIAAEFIYPALKDMYAHYTENYLHYLLFAGSFFSVILSFWVFTICTEWKIINFAFLPFLSGLFLYAYDYAVTHNFVQVVQKTLPFKLSRIWIIPICFTAIAFLFFSYTAILLAIRHLRKNPKSRHPKIKKVKEKKREKQNKFKRLPRRSRVKRKENIDA